MQGVENVKVGQYITQEPSRWCLVVGFLEYLVCVRVIWQVAFVLSSQGKGEPQDQTCHNQICWFYIGLLWVGLKYTRNRRWQVAIINMKNGSLCVKYPLFITLQPLKILPQSIS